MESVNEGYAHVQYNIQYDAKERSTVSFTCKAKEFYRIPMKFDNLVAEVCDILKKNCRGHDTHRMRIKGS